MAVFFMRNHPTSTARAARVLNVALGLIEYHEQRIRNIIESEQATPDEKYQALVDLAHLTNILVREMAEAEAGG